MEEDRREIGCAVGAICLLYVLLFHVQSQRARYSADVIKRPKEAARKIQECLLACTAMLRVEGMTRDELHENYRSPEQQCDFA